MCTLIILDQEATFAKLLQAFTFSSSSARANKVQGESVAAYL
jgi:hypothetical protein